MPRPSAEGRGLFSTITAGERLGPSLPFHLVALLVLRIRKLGLSALATAAFCSTIGRLVAADPSVEVYTQDSVVTSAEEGDTSLFAYTPKFSATIGTGYDDNVNANSTGGGGLATSAGGGGSFFTQTHVTLSKDLRIGRTQVSIKIGGGAVYYFDRPGRSTDVTGTLNASLKHSFSERLKLIALIDVAYLAEPDFGTDLGPQGRANYLRTVDTLTVTYNWSPRLSSDSIYELRSLNFQNTSVNAGQADQAGQNRVEQSFSELFRYRWSPRTTLIAEYRFGLINYDSSLRNSSTNTAISGFDLLVNSRLNVTFRGGATFRTYEDETKDDRIDPYLSASLHYKIGASTSANWTASYSVEEPNSVGSLSRTTIRTGLQLSYAFTKRLTSNLNLNYHHDQNDGALTPGPANRGAFAQDAFEVTLGTKFALTSRLAWDLGYTHSELGSGGQTSGYSRNRYSTGLTLTY